MKTSRVSFAVTAGAVALALGGSARAGEPATGQAQAAEATMKLESAFSEQFVKGHIDRTALAPLVTDVVQAMPEGARSRVQSHVDEILAAGEQAATQMTPEQRARAAAKPSDESIGKTAAAQVTAWGWPGYGGFGGLGAFGFPGMYNMNCIPYGGGYSVPYVGWGTVGYSSGSYSQYSCATGIGYGLGGTGWYW